MRYFFTIAFLLIGVFLAKAQTNISGIINNYAAVTNINVSCSVNQMTVDNAAAFNVGDTVLIIQMQGATIDVSNSVNFGNITNLGSAGLYEKNVIASKTGNILDFAFVLSNSYDVNGSVQIVSIPHYAGNVTVNGVLTASDWDGTKGGVLIFSASGNVQLTSAIDMRQKGFRGGVNAIQPSYSCNFTTNRDAYFYPLNSELASGKGEGIAKFTLNRESGRGKQANGGGGGNDHNSGGGGGGNGSAGGRGGINDEPGNFNCDGDYPGEGGLANDYSGNRIFMGGGAGVGHGNNAAYTAPDGGGIVIIKANSVGGFGSNIFNQGITGALVSNDGGIGGSAGGSVLLEVNTWMAALNINTSGGNGGNTDNINNRCYGPGGGGGGGAFFYSTPNYPNNYISNAGIAGIVTNSTNGCNGSNLGATNATGPGISVGNRSILTSNQAFIAGSSLVINEDPVNDTICSGSISSFTVNASGSGLTYQWQQNAGSGWSNTTNGGFFQGVTTDSLTLVFTNASYNGRQFRVLIADACGSLDTSNIATLYVNSVVSIAVLAQIDVCEGQSFSIGGFDPSIPANQINQWQINTGSGFIDLEDDSQNSGTNTSFLLIDSATVAQHDGALIRVYYTAPGCDTVFSSTALVNIYSADPIVNDTACIGQSASFTVNVNGIDSFQWQIFNGTWTNLTNTAPYSGVNTASLNISSVGVAQAGMQFRVLFFRNGVNQPLCIENNLSPSNQATLVSPAPLAITSQSGPISLCTNQSGQIYIQANGVLSSIQWQVDLGSGTFANAVNGPDYSGVTNDTLNIISAALIENGDRFRAIITNDCGESLTSSIINLSVFPAPSVSISATQTVCQGNNVFVSISSIQGSNISYQWQVDSSGVWQNLTNGGGYSNTNGSFLGFAGSIVVPSIFTDRYRVIINTDCGPDTSGNMQLNVIPNAQITTQPQNLVVCLGDTASISVLANNAVSYQWQSNAGGPFANLTNNATFSGVTTSSLTINNVGVAQTGILYRVVIAGAFPCSNVTSASASISLTGPTTINGQSVNISSCQGIDTFLYVTTTSGAAGFQWQLNSGSGFANITNGGVYSGATNDTLFISPVQTAMDGNQYQCIVTSTCGANPTSTPITLTIGANLNVLSQPDSILVCVGENAPFVLEANGSGLTYQWQQFNGATWTNVNNGGFFQGTTTDSLTVLNVQASYNGRLYRCLLNDACGNSVISDTALLSVNNVIPVLLSGSFSICENSSGSLGDASAPASQSYQWQQNDNQGSGWLNLSNNATFTGVNTGFLLISNAPLSLDGDSIRLITFNPACDSVVSGILLNIDTIAVVTSLPTNQNVCLGSPVQFGITASGSPTYQWQIFNGSAFVNIANGAVYQGVTTDSLSILSATSSLNNANYRLLVTSNNPACGSVNVIATLTVQDTIVLINQSNDLSICPNTDTALFIQTNIPATNIQWQVFNGTSFVNLSSGLNYQGVNSDSLLLIDVPSSFDGNVYRAYFQDSCGVADTSILINLQVATNVFVQLQPTSITTCEGDDASFEITASGSPVSYQWQVQVGAGFVDLVDGPNYSGTQTDSLYISNIPLSFSGNIYQCQITGTCNQDISTIAVLQVNPNVSSSISPTLCFGDSFQLSNSSYVLVSGTYQDTLANAAANGCDSIVTINLNILPLASSNISPNLCFGDSFALSNGSFLTSSGLYTDTLFGASSSFCDSLVNIDLSIAPLLTTSSNINLCFGDSLALSNGSFVASSGIYNDTLFNAGNNGCDSIHVINLNIAPLLVSNLSISICSGDSFVLSNGTSVNTAGIYNDTLFAASSNACDSLVIIDLTVTPPNIINYPVSICFGDSFVFSDGSFTTLAGIYNDTLQNASASSCDSIVVIDLSIFPLARSNNPQTICAGGSYVLPGGQSVTIAGVYNDTLLNASSQACDSIVVTDLTVLPVPSTSYTDAFCSGGSYTLPSGTIVNVAGIYNDTLFSAAANGCDSVNVIDLSILAPIAGVSVIDTICFNEFYTLPSGQQVNATGSYTDTLSNAFGCDSTITTNLFVKPANSILQESSNVLLCSGEAHSFFAQSVQNNVTYQWFVNGNPMPGETNDTLSFTSVSAAQSGNIYQLRLIGDCDTIFASAVQLNIRAVPSISSDPQDQIVCEGANVIFSIAVSSAVQSYQWFENNLALANSNNSSYTISNVSLIQDGNSYFCITTDSCGNLDTSITALLTVNPLPSISNEGANQSICSGEDALFFVEASGLNLTYQWSANNVALPAQNNDTLLLTNVSASLNNTVYRCVISSTCGNLTSTGFTLEVSDTSTLFSQSSNIQQCGGFSFELNVEATNIASYQWQINQGSGFVNLVDGTLGANQAEIIGSTSANLLVSNFDPSISGSQFQVIMTVACGQAPIFNPISVQITEPVPFEANFKDTTICQLELQALYVPYVSASALWSNGDIGQYFFPETSGQYVVSFLDDNSCPASDTINIDLEDCVAKCVVTAPTGFSPNASSKNDIFRAIYGCDLSFFQLSVYNRWGELVYFTDKPQDGWDGVYKGRDAEISVYAWYIRYQKVGSDKLESIQGNVSLIR